MCERVQGAKKSVSAQTFHGACFLLLARVLSGGDSHALATVSPELFDVNQVADHAWATTSQQPV